jgi:hypothetical protein
MTYKKGDKHPTKDRVFWSYSHKEGNPNRKEMWMTPAAYERKVNNFQDLAKTDEFKKKQRQYYQAKKEYFKQKDKERKTHFRKHNPFALMISSLRTGAKRRNMNFEITEQDLQNLWDKQKGKCYYTKLDMNFTFHLSLPKQMSLDRVDPCKGYSLDNIVLCCQFINYAKHDYKLEDFLEFLEELRNSKF